MQQQIASFDREHRFLSNFWPAPVTYEGVTYRTVEHAYQAAKTLNLRDRVTIQHEYNPAQAKRLGRTVQLRTDWNDIRIGVMAELLIQKFTNNEPLRELLLATGDAELIEGNYWGDTFWGVCRGKGENNLGKLLMAVREHYRNLFT